MSQSQSQPTRTCPHCGSELERRTVDMNGREWFVGYAPCTCKASQDEARRLEVEEENRQAEERRAKRESAYKRAGVPKAYWSAQITNRSERLASEIEDGKSVLLTGKVGCGKTYLASAVSMLLIDNGLSVRFLKDRDLLGMLRDVYNGTASERMVMDTLRGYDVLVIDDMGKEAPTDWVQAKLFAVIDSRYDDMRPTLVTTHYEPDEFVRRLTGKGDSGTARSIVSRLLDKERGVHVVLSGGDRRVC